MCLNFIYFYVLAIEKKNVADMLGAASSVAYTILDIPENALSSINEIVGPKKKSNDKNSATTVFNVTNYLVFLLTAI